MADYIFTQNGDNNVQIGTDRLTGDFKGASMFATVEQARQYNRLRQYEDTGLMPEEIVALKADRDQWQDGTIIVKLADTEADRDAWRRRAEAAIKDMWTMRSCQSCKHKPKDYTALHGACKDCDDEDKWEWRGPEEDKP